MTISGLSSYLIVLGFLLGWMTVTSAALSNLGGLQKFRDGMPENLNYKESYVKQKNPRIKRNLKDINIKIFPRNFIDRGSAVTKFIATHESEVLVDVLEGSASINDLNKNTLKEIPPQFMAKVKNDVIKEISSDSLAEMLDSDVIAQDVPSLKKMLKRFDDTQLEESMAKISEKTRGESGTMLNPAIAVQESIAEEFMRRNIKRGSNKKDQVAVLDKFVTVMCPFVSGLSPGDINKLPVDSDKTAEIMECFAENYKDLDKAQRTQFAKYLMKVDRGNKEAIKPSNYGPFMLDVSSKLLSRKMSASELNEMLQGDFADLDPTSPNFKTFARSVMSAIVQHNISYLYEEANLVKLDIVLCEYSFDQLRKRIDAAQDVLVAKAYLKMCGMGDTSSEIQECTPAEKKRLKRCQEAKKRPSTTKPKRKKPTVNVSQFKMMRTAAKTLLKDKNLTQLTTADVEDVASALGGLKPREIKEIPDSAILSAMSTIKTNKNLSRKQKRLMLKKARSAGLEITNQTKLADIGELVTAVGAKELRQIPAKEILSNIKVMTDHADSFSGPQRKSIIRKLQELDVNEMMGKDLGVFAAEIPLRKIKELKTVNFTMLKDKPWNRGQAAKLIELANITKDYDLDAVKVRELGRTVVGLKCGHIKKVPNDEVLSVAVAIHDSTDMSFDMDECVALKLEKANIEELGTDYLKNTSNPDLPDTIGSIPSDVALFSKLEMIDDTSPEVCSRLVEQIGRADLDSLPTVGNVSRGKQFAESSVICLMRSENRTGGDGLSEEEVFKLGDMLCYIPPDQITKIQDNATESALEKLKSCIPRFSRDQVLPVVEMVYKQLGADISTWTVEGLAQVGPVIALLEKSEIEKIDGDTFLEAIDDIIPPTEVSSRDVVNSAAFYQKAIEVLSTPTAENRRKRRETGETVPDFDQITALGDGNVNWTPEQLSSISDEDFANSLPVLGAIENWSDEATVALYDHMIQTFDEPAKWEAEVISEAKHILVNMSFTDILKLNLTDPDAVSSLSEIPFDHIQRGTVSAGYMIQNSKTMWSLTSDDVTALGDIMCGSSALQLASLGKDVVRDLVECARPMPMQRPQRLFAFITDEFKLESMAELGYSECFNQAQSDVLYSIVMMSNDMEIPDASLLQEMGSLAAGLAVSELLKVPVESMPFIKEIVFKKIDPVRIRDGLSVEQLKNAGVTNIAAILNNPDLYPMLRRNQQIGLQMEAYGEIKMPLAELPTVAKDDDYVDGIDVQLDNSGEAVTIASMETTADGSGSPGNSPYVATLFVSIAISFVCQLSC